MSETDKDAILIRLKTRRLLARKELAELEQEVTDLDAIIDEVLTWDDPPIERPKPNPSQRTLGMEELPPEVLEIVVPGQRKKAALRGPRERMPSENWDKDAVPMCYSFFMEILEDSPDGAPIVHVAHTLCLNTANAYAAMKSIIRNYPFDYAYVGRKPWPQDKRKLRGIMHIDRAQELGLEIIKIKEKEKPHADK